MNVGLYTNWYDYQQIVGSTTALRVTDLWYWHVLGAGSGAETPRDFNDYRQFGPFRNYPIAKQYGIGEQPCGLTANQDVFPANARLNSKTENKLSVPIGEGARFVLPAEQENNTVKKQ